MRLITESGLARSSMTFFSALSRSANQGDFAASILNSLKRIFGYRNSAFIFLDTESFEAGYPLFRNIPASSIEKYHSWYREEAIFLKAIIQDKRLLSRKLLSLDDVIGEREYERSVYYRDIAKPAGARDVLVMPIAGGQRICGGLAIFKPQADGSFSDEEKKIFSMLNNPISSLLVNHLETLRLQEEANSAGKALDGLFTGVIVLDQDGSLVRINKAARRLCARLHPGEGDRPVYSLLGSLGERIEPGKAKGETLCGMGDGTVNLRIVPDSYVTPTRRIATRITIHLEEGGPKVDRLSLISERYGLSAREAEIVDFVVRGKDNPGIAEALFLSPNTVRTHLQNIYRKLSVNSRISVIGLFQGISP
jgi:DNA-binding CsgD family transcriptional regulator